MSCKHSVIIERNVAFGLVRIVAGRAEVARGNQVFANLVGELRSVPPIDQLVAGQLLGEKAVVRFVGVERADHVIAILPLPFADDDAVGVDVESDRVGVADDVEPVPPPPFAKARRRQQPIDLARERVGRRIGQELSEFFGRRRQAVQIEKGPPQQSRLGRPCGEKLRPLASNCLSKKASIGVLARAAFRGTGTAGRRTFRKAQCSLSRAVTSADSPSPPEIARGPSATRLPPKRTTNVRRPRTDGIVRVSGGQGGCGRFQAGDCQGCNEDSNAPACRETTSTVSDTA